MHVIAAMTSAAGALALCSPERLTRLACGATTARPPAWLVRLLGARYLAQAAAELGHPTRRVWLVSSAIDNVHAATMVAAAFTWPSYRRAALVSGGFASCSAVATAFAARSP
jgi:hypothetical protein